MVASAAFSGWAHARGWNGLDLGSQASLQQTVVIVEALHRGQGSHDLFI
jgi:hypothetical protein